MPEGSREGEHPDIRLVLKQAYAGILSGISFMIVLFGVGILAMVFTSTSWSTTQGMPVPPDVVAEADRGYAFGGGFLILGIVGMVSGWVRLHRIQRRRRAFWERWVHSRKYNSRCRRGAWRSPSPRARP